MHIDALPAFQDNYIWLIDNGRQALVVDPGDAGPVLAACRQRDLDLVGILVTHHHADHCGGLAELLAQGQPAVWGPAGIVGVNQPVRGGDSLYLAELGLRFDAIAVPGHTLDHLAYYAADPGWLFCGDTLFSVGCGRLFEGTPQQMLDSLDRLAALPGSTLMFCAHEYTLRNLEFAQAVNPGQPELIAYHSWCVQQRAAGRPTLPSTMQQQRALNPFLRVDQSSVQDALMRHWGQAPASRTEALAALRRWKNQF